MSLFWMIMTGVVALLAISMVAIGFAIPPLPKTPKDEQ